MKTSTYIYWFLLSWYFLFKLAYLFNMAVYSTAQNKSISMSMDSMNSTENWMDKGISLCPNYTVGADLLIYLCAPVWLRYEVSLRSPWMSLLRYYSWLFFFFRSNKSLNGGKKNLSVHWCSAAQPKDRLWLNLWVCYVSDEVFIIATSQYPNTMLRDLSLPTEAWSRDLLRANLRKQLHLSDILKSDDILWER